MLIQLLFAETFHFAISVFGAFVFFAAGLLYLDSWNIDKSKKTPLIRCIGFFILSIVFAFHASAAEQAVYVFTAQVLEILGLCLIFASLIFEPILHPPSSSSAKASADKSEHKPPSPIRHAGLSSISYRHRRFWSRFAPQNDVGFAKTYLFAPFSLPVLTWALVPLSAVFSFLISFTYLRKATEGYERQLKPAFFAFLFLGLAKIFQIPQFWSETPIIYWSRILSQFGLVFNAQHVFELIGMTILGIWIWGYIRFRVQVQLFVMVIALSLILFLTTTVFYTFLLLRNLETEALSHLKTDVSVLQYSLESLKEQTLAYAEAIAQDSEIKLAFIENDKDKLLALSTDFMAAQKTSTLLIVTSSGDVVIRAEDSDRAKENVSDELIVRSAIQGKAQSTVEYQEGITYPQINVKAAVPLRDSSSRSSGKIIGSVITGFTVDSAFVDRVKASTGLDVAVFGQNKRAATTFVAPDGKSRFVGTLETNEKVLDKVLNNGEIYIGASQILNQPFYTAYSPLRTVGDEVIGMLFVGKLQNTLSESAKKSIDLTFLGSMVLIVLSLIPAYFFSRFLKEQLEA